ncbi:MAG: 4,5-DOPA dioxygenase extradiol [bacterium]
MPVLFIGHGSPENAFEINEFSSSWQNITTLFPKPKAILVISAHWTNITDQQAKNASITTNQALKTIHDFYGFPRNFYDFNYKANGSPNLAQKIISEVHAVTIDSAANWGLDHGAWSVLAQMYPAADIPTLQLSIDETLPRSTLFKIGEELIKFRDEGVLIIGSGNIVHNLAQVRWNYHPANWAIEFDDYIQKSLATNNKDNIISFENHPLQSLALPTVEHFLPLLYVMGASQDEKPFFFSEKIFAHSLSMRCVAYGLN